MIKCSILTFAFLFSIFSLNAQLYTGPILKINNRKKDLS